MTEVLLFQLGFTLLSSSFIKAQEGINPIPLRDLYGDDFRKVEIQVPECSQQNLNLAGDFIECWKVSKYHKDYGCRYHNGLRPMCYCCGAYYHYIEHGPICTKFCLNEDSKQDGRELGQEMISILILPFNWGWDVPEKITLEDGSEVPVKCDPLDGKNFGCNDGRDDNIYRRTTTVVPSHVKTPLSTTKQPQLWEKTKTTTTRKAEKIIQTTRTTTLRTTTLSKTITRTTATKRTTTVDKDFENKPSRITQSESFPGQNKQTTTKTTNSFGEIVWSKKLEGKRKREPKEITLVEGLPVWG